jgi:hypothetical protein
MTLVGGAIATVVMAVLGRYGITFQAGVETAMSVIFAAALGYLPASGRKP